MKTDMTQDEMQLVGKATHFCLWCALVCPPAAFLLDLLRVTACMVWDCKNLDWNYEFLAKHTDIVKYKTFNKLDCFRRLLLSVFEKACKPVRGATEFL
jgi:hypothetical protein